MQNSRNRNGLETREAAGTLREAGYLSRGSEELPRAESPRKGRVHYLMESGEALDETQLGAFLKKHGSTHTATGKKS